MMNKFQEYALALEYPGYYRRIHEDLRRQLESSGFTQRVAAARTSGLLKEDPDSINSVLPKDRVIRATKLLRQSRNFIQMGTQSDEEIKPLLLYYGVAQAWAFTVSSFLSYKELSRSHGLTVTSGDGTFHVAISESGSFVRLVDFCAILRAESAHSKIKWDSQNDRFVIQQADETRGIRPYEFSISIDTLFKDMDRHVEMATSPQQELLIDEDCYMLLFVASHFARYRPEVWEEIVRAENDIAMIYYKKALERAPLMYEKAVETFIHAAKGSDPLAVLYYHKKYP